MPQVVIYVSPKAADIADVQLRQISVILERYGLHSSVKNGFPTSHPAQEYRTIAVPESATARAIITELQANGISAFLKPDSQLP